MSQQIRSVGLAAQLKLVTEGVLEVDLIPAGFIRSAETWKYR